MKTKKHKAGEEAMAGRMMIPVILEGAGAERFYEPSLSRLPEWLDLLASNLCSQEVTADLYQQEIVGLRNWAAVAREWLAKAEPHGL